MTDVIKSAIQKKQSELNSLKARRVDYEKLSLLRDDIEKEKQKLNLLKPKNMIQKIIIGIQKMFKENDGL